MQAAKLKQIEVAGADAGALGLTGKTRACTRGQRIYAEGDSAPLALQVLGDVIPARRSASRFARWTPPYDPAR